MNSPLVYMSDVDVDGVVEVNWRRDGYAKEMEGGDAQQEGRKACRPRVRPC